MDESVFVLRMIIDGLDERLPCLQENKEPFEDGATIFHWIFNDKRMDRRKVGLFSIYDVLIGIKRQYFIEYL